MISKDLFAVEEIENAGYTLEGAEVINEDLDGDGDIEEIMFITGTNILKDGKECATIILPGDLNGDGSIGPTDLSIISSIANQTYEATDIELLAADINNDGYVSSADSDLLLERFTDIYSPDYWKVGTRGERTKIPVVISEPQ